MALPLPWPTRARVVPAHPRAANDNIAPRTPRARVFRWADDPGRFFLVLLTIGSVVTLGYMLAITAAALLGR